MCDVCIFRCSWVRILTPCKVCKYHKRTNLRYGKLSSEEFALTQLASNRNTSCQDEDDQPDQQPDRKYDKQQVNADSRLVRGQSKAPVKRPSDQGSNRDHKKLKVEMAPPLGTFRSCWTRSPDHTHTMYNSHEALQLGVSLEEAFQSSFANLKSCWEHTGSSSSSSNGSAS